MPHPQWKVWEDEPSDGQSLRLTPVWPIVFHTGPGGWNTNRRFVDLLAGPEELRRFGPIWEPVFWNLRIDGVEDLSRLKAAVRGVRDLQRLEELEL